MPGKNQNRYFYERRQKARRLKMSDQSNPQIEHEPAAKTPARRKFPWLGLIAGILVVAAVTAAFFLGRTASAPATSVTAVVPTPTPTSTTKVSETTKEAPVAELTKVAVAPKAAVVKVNGIEYGTNFDNRLTFTNGEILFKHPAPYNTEELKQISNTPVEYTIEMPENAAFPVAFGYQIETNKVYSPGAIILLPVDQGKIKVKILDGELVLWRSLSAMHTDLSERISVEIKNGNLSINRPLAFSFCSQEFASYIPQDLLTSRKVTIVK